MFRKKSCHSLFSLTGLTVSGLLVLMVLFGELGIAFSQDTGVFEFKFRIN